MTEPTASAPAVTCGRPEWRTAAATLLLWVGSLFTFSFAHYAASCSTSNTTSFVVAAASLAVGSIAAGVLGDRVGRSATARLLFVLGTLACVASAATHPDDGRIILVFAGAAAISAGGSHVSAELLLESLPEQYRALVLLTYPALFFPAGAVQYLFEQVGWYSSATITAFFVLAGGLSLLQLEESRLFTRPSHRPLGRDVVQPATPRRGDSSIPAGFSLADDIRQPDLDSSFVARLHSGINRFSCCGRRKRGQGHDGASTSAAEVKDGPCSRLVLATSSLWLLFTLAYYLTSLTFLLPEPPAPAASAIAGSMCPRTSAARATAAPVAIVPPPSTAACPAIGTFSSGAHLVLAEVTSVFLVAGLANTKRFGRRLTLALAFALSTIACATAAGTMPSFGCSGTALRATLEFFVRVSLAAAAQALFLYTLEVCATSVRSTVVGLCVGLFRLGGLLTMANNLASGADTRLQWSVSAAQQLWSSLTGAAVTSVSRDTATTAVLICSAQACLLSCCLSFVLPVEPRTKLLRPAPGQPFTDSRVGAEQGGLDRGLVSCGLAQAVGAALRAAGAQLPASLGGGSATGHVAYGRVDEEEEDRTSASGSVGGDLSSLESAAGADKGGGAGAKGYAAVGRGDGGMGGVRGAGRGGRGSLGVDDAGLDLELEMAVLGRPDSSGAGRNQARPGGSGPTAAARAIDPAPVGQHWHEQRALRWFPGARGRSRQQRSEAAAGAGGGGEAQGGGVGHVYSLSFSVAGLSMVSYAVEAYYHRWDHHPGPHDAQHPAGSVSRQGSRHGHRQAHHPLHAAPPVPPPPPRSYAGLSLSRAIAKAEEERDAAAAAWIGRQLEYLKASAVRQGLVDLLDLELHGLDTAGLDVTGLGQEATRFRLLARMWAARAGTA